MKNGCAFISFFRNPNLSYQKFDPHSKLDLKFCNTLGLVNSDWFVLKFSGYNRAKETSVTTCEVLQQDSKPKLNKCIHDNDDSNAIQISNEAGQKLVLNQDGFYKVRLYFLSLILWLSFWKMLEKCTHLYRSYCTVRIYLHIACHSCCKEA